MSNYMNGDRRTVNGARRAANGETLKARFQVVMAAMLLAAWPTDAHAQFGRLKQLKNAISPDSAAKAESAVKDSIALAAKLAAGDTTPLQRSKFSRAVSAAGAASEKFEQVTGVSAK